MNTPVVDSAPVSSADGSSATTSPVSVSILDREYLIACSPEERPGLIAAASYLDGKMREIRTKSRAAGLDRIAVLAALNIAHELVGLKQYNQNDNLQMTQHLQILKSRLDAAFSKDLQ